MKFRQLLIGIQSIYMLLTGVWPLLDITTFIEVTGPKRDIWLVKTVGALLIPLSIALFYQLFTKERVTAILLGALSSIAFGAIDFKYALDDTISDVYLVDGVVQCMFLLSWLIMAISGGSRFTTE
jgi:hypothetical protein